MNQFWPSRPSPEGFSIEKLARGYREKISKNNLVSMDRDVNKELNLEKDLAIDSGISSKPFREGLGHWANRDFKEYLDAA